MNAVPVPNDKLGHFGAGDTAESAARLFRLKLTTQAGTYVKEFVHGDFGRTSPNLREILGVPDLDIIALDVLVSFFVHFMKWY
jgi:tRNA U54 and U55 pseudouridine synthase Pus10